MKQGFEKREGGLMYSVVGMSRCGKTTFTTAKVQSAKRLIVWDPAGQFANKLGCQTVRNAKELWKLIKHNRGSGKYALNFMGDGKDLKQEFSHFCYISFYWGVINQCTVVAEELAQVTNTAKAEGYWGTLVRNGLKYGINIFAMAQRTQEIDNTLLGNCSFNVQFKVIGDDIDKSAKRMGVSPPADFYKFLEKDNKNNTMRHGTTTERDTVAYKK